MTTEKRIVVANKKINKDYAAIKPSGEVAD
jgi:hypothetical protein